MRIFLPGSASPTTRLGYGTSGLHGGLAKRESLRLLEEGFEHGIRHFDTAPLYGLGAAEGVVGEFLQRRKEGVTVATKFGLAPPRGRAFWEAARTLAGPFLKKMPALKRRLVQTMSEVAAAPAHVAESRFTPIAMRESLEASLRALRREHVDVFLLHEADAGDISDDLRSELDRVVASGSVGAWGLASARAAVDRVRQTDAPALALVQTDESAESAPIERDDGSFLVTHGMLSSSFRELPLGDASWRKRLADAVEADIEAPGAMARLLMSAALAKNDGGVVLFTSKQPSHIREICGLLADESTRSGQALLDFISQHPHEGAQI